MLKPLARDLVVFAMSMVEADLVPFSSVTGSELILSSLASVALQRFRESRFQAQDYIILLLAGATLGFLSDVKDTNLGSTGYTYTIIAICEESSCASITFWFL